MAVFQAAEPKSLSDPEVLRRVNRLRQSDNWTNWVYLGREYAFLASVLGPMIFLFEAVRLGQIPWFWALPAALLANLCVGAGQHRLATLTHEAAHYMLFRNRTLNEFVSEWFCMFPILGTTHTYRVQHLGHHQYPNDPERDPDWVQTRLSGHRFAFPMSWGQFLWRCVFKQILWPPNLLRYIRVRASYIVDLGEDGPYHMKRRGSRVLGRIGLGYHLILLSCLAVAVSRADCWLAAVAPALLWLTSLAIYSLAPARWFAEFGVKSDLSVRTQARLRLTFNTLLLTTLTWLTLLTGMPWWLYYFILWLVPLTTSFAFFMVLRQIVQHGNADQARFTNTRVYQVHPLVSMAVFPIGNDYHLPHHLFPMVPHYHLRELHELLMTTDEYQQQAVVVRGSFLSPEPPPRVHPTMLDVMTK